MRTIPGLIRAVERQIDVMIDVATGGTRIADANASYIRNRRRIERMLLQIGVEDPNPYSDLWQWYQRWSSGDLPSYQSRRTHIRELYQPLQDALANGAALKPRAPTGWARVDRTLEKARLALAQARDEEDFQGVGLLCREVVISLATATFDPAKHLPAGCEQPGPADAGRLLELVVSAQLPGSSNEELRKHARSTLALANALQHRRTASFRDGALCSEVTSSLVQHRGHRGWKAKRLNRAPPNPSLQRTRQKRRAAELEYR